MSLLPPAFRRGGSGYAGMTPSDKSPDLAEQAKEKNRTVRCPRCRSTSFELVETFEEIETRQVRNGAVSRQSDHTPGSLLSTECSCKCGHSWVPRQSTLEALER